jgi:hypothetical protein
MVCRERNYLLDPAIEETIVTRRAAPRFALELGSRRRRRFPGRWWLSKFEIRMPMAAAAANTSVYSVMMSIFRYAFGVQLPNPFAIFQGR